MDGATGCTGYAATRPERQKVKTREDCKGEFI